MIDIFEPLEVIVEDKVIDDFYKERVLDNISFKDVNINGYAILRSNIDNKKTVVVRRIGKTTYKNVVQTNPEAVSGITPRDVKQFMLMESFQDDSILMSVGLGAAGTGKSTIAIAYALADHFQTNRKIHLCKPTTLVGTGKSTFGPVPGDMHEKYAPHIQHFYCILEDILGEKSKSYIEAMMHKGQINFTPIEYARGFTFKNSVFIVDEVQNLSWHELKTICSRMGENTKLILLGDLKQIDRRYSLRDSGIYNMITSRNFLESNLSSCIHLTEQYRSPLATLIADIDDETAQND